MKFLKDEIRQSMCLYAVTDSRWLKPGQTLESVCREVLASGATFLQYREKELPDDAFAREAEELQKLCRQYRVPFVVNDRVEVALAINADGVHVGQSDLQGRALRSMLGDKILGISAGTVTEALEAQAAGADYIGVGAVFGTDTKGNARTGSLEMLRAIVRAVDIPVVAIGGISRENLQQLSGTGADGIAVVSAIFAQEDPGTATQMLRRLTEDVVHDEAGLRHL